jgi:hypothetical protein
MKKFENVKLVMFDSTNASFKLAVEAQFVRNTPQGPRDLVYTTDKGSAMLNPNIYLTFTYKTDGLPNPVYTSYPQLFRIRAALETVKDLVVDGKGFVKVENVYTAVNSNYATPVVVDNIGKAANWISFKLVMIESGENGVITKLPGVALELSTSNGYASILTVEEFLTIYSIVHDLDLTTLQAVLSLGFLESKDGGATGAFYQGQMQPPYYQPQPAPYYQPQGQPMYQQPQQRAPQTPRYGNNGYRGNGAPQQGGRAAVVPQQPVANNQPRQQAPVAQQGTTNLPPRNTQQPVMNLGAVEETPVSNLSFDDESAIDEIFND